MADSQLDETARTIVRITVERHAAYLLEAVREGAELTGPGFALDLMHKAFEGFAALEGELASRCRQLGLLAVALVALACGTPAELGEAFDCRSAKPCDDGFEVTGRYTLNPRFSCARVRVPDGARVTPDQSGSCDDCPTSSSTCELVAGGRSLVLWSSDGAPPAFEDYAQSADEQCSLSCSDGAS